MKPKITFEYYDGTNKKRPPMSAGLYEAIQDAVDSIGATHCHIVHVGTVGDPKTHRPGTSHMQDPPEAIDVRKVFLKFKGWWTDGCNIKAIDLELMDSLANRKLVADVWKSVDGVCAHVNSRKHHHIHLQTPKSEWGGG